ncbi:MAG: DsrE family protein [Luminiphilus sp.]|nr:DsrE family protein [Luminiphilus sp.]
MTEPSTWLIRIHTAPYVNSQAALGIDAILACGAFGQSVIFVLEGPAIDLLTPPQEPVEGGRNLFKLITSMPLYDIDKVYLVTDSPRQIPATHFDELQVKPVNREELAHLIANSRHVLSF